MVADRGVLRATINDFTDKIRYHNPYLESVWILDTSVLIALAEGNHLAIEIVKIAPVSATFVVTETAWSEIIQESEREKVRPSSSY